MPINLDSVEEKEGMSFEPLPEGVYYCRITDAADKEAVGDKNAQHEFELTVQTGKFANRKFKHWFAITEKMAPYLKHFYRVLGVTDFKNINPVDHLGKPFMAEVYIDEYNGKRNNKLQLGCYYEWDGKDESATGTKPEKKEVAATSKPVPTASTKPAPKKDGPFSNSKPAAAASGDKSADEPPF